MGVGLASYVVSVTLNDSTVSGNTVSDGSGGGIDVSAGSNLSVRASTISGNSAGFGGGISDYGATSVSLASSTIADNSDTFGGIFAQGGDIVLAGSIVADNNPDCSSSAEGGFVSDGYNLDGDGTCGFTDTGDANAFPADIGALSDNGGLTQTMPLSLTSYAADAVPVGTTEDGVQLCPRTGQNGITGPGPGQTGCAMGAVEARGAEAPVNTLWVSSGGSNTANSCANPAEPCATVTYALTQMPSGSDPLTVEISGTIYDHVTVPPGRLITLTGADAPAASPAVLDGSSDGPVIYTDTSADLELDDLTIQHGEATAANHYAGGGIAAFDASVALTDVTVTDNEADFSGAGIFDAGAVYVADSNITDNTVGCTCIPPEGEYAYGGGGIGAYGNSLSITDSTISGNEAVDNSPGGGGVSNWNAPITIADSTISDNSSAGLGGGVEANTSAAITNSTIADNSAGGQGANSTGGGIWTDSDVLLTGSTITGNSGSFGGAGVDSDRGAGTVTTGGSIIAANTGADCSAAVASVGYNIDGDGTCGLSGTGDVSKVNPNLSALASNGGLTLTELPPSTSPAVGRIPPGTTLNGISVCPRTDQRGMPGPAVGQTDCTIGADESGDAAAPGFTSAAKDSVFAGARFAFKVTTSGLRPTLRLAASAVLPPNVVFTDSGDGTGLLAGFAKVGSYSFTLQAVNGVSPDATQMFTLTVTRATQAPLTVTSTSGALVGLVLATRGGSGLGPVTYTAADGTASGCTVSSTKPYTLSSTSTGTCVVTANKGADADYQSATSGPTTVTLTLATQAPLIVTSTSGMAGTLVALTTSGGSGTGAVTYLAADGTASGCAVSSTTPYTLSSTSAGTCVVTATKAADADYLSASSAPTTVTLSPASQAPLVVTSTSGTYGRLLALATRGGSGSGAVTYAVANGTASGCDVVATDALSSTSPGTCTVRATKAASTFYMPISSASTAVTLRARVPSPPMGVTSGQRTAAAVHGAAGVAVDSAGNLYVAEYSADKVVKIAPSGAQTAIGSGWSHPIGVAVDSLGNVYVTDSGNQRVEKVTPAGVQSTLGSGFSDPDGVAVDSAGDVYVADYNLKTVTEITPAGGQYTFSSGYGHPQGVAVDGFGNVYVTDLGTGALWEITPSGSTVIARGFHNPEALAVNLAGDVYVADNSSVSEVTLTGTVTTVGSGFGTVSGVAADSKGDVFVSDFTNNDVVELTDSPSAVASSTPGEVNVSWAPPMFSGGDPVSTYEVTAVDRTATTRGGQSCSYTVSTPEKDTCTVTGLSAGDSYTFSVVARNAVGASQASTASRPVTAPGVLRPPR